jgi:hypothetical protein
MKNETARTKAMKKAVRSKTMMIALFISGLPYPLCEYFSI